MSARRTFDDYKSAIENIHDILIKGPFLGSIRNEGNIYRDVMEILVDFGYVSNTSSRNHPSYVWNDPSIIPTDQDIKELIGSILEKNRKTHKKKAMEATETKNKWLRKSIEYKITAIVELLVQGKTCDRIYRELNENPALWKGKAGAKVSFDYIRDTYQIWKRLGCPKDPVEVIEASREKNKRDRRKMEQKEAPAKEAVMETELFPMEEPPCAGLDNLLLTMAICLETLASEIRRYINVERPEED